MKNLMHLILLALIFLPLSARADNSCDSNGFSQTLEGHKGLYWKAHSTCDSVSNHYHVIALTNITDAFTSEPTGYRVPTIKELITLAEYDGVNLPTVDSWLVGAGYLLSSTYGTTTSGIKTLMVLDAATKAVVELPMTDTGGLYYLLAVHKTGEVINN